ncbi:calponin homology domain-containing protein [Chytridium lagenaria]|nr:calponin homology domain-containing protein [Chytridium lagenaria]
MSSSKTGSGNHSEALKKKGPNIVVSGNTLESDFSSGEKLILLMESLSDASLGRYNKLPKMRIQKVENVGTALSFIKKRGVALTNIGAEDIVDENAKLLLGLIWSIILRFDIAEISEEGLSAKEGLLLWCQRKTVPYAKDFHIKDFQGSWTDGLALCGLIHRHRPDLIDYWALDKSSKRENTKLAMDVAEAYLVEDLVDIAKPDERSVITYISQFYHAFSAMDKVGVAGRRVAQLGQILIGAWEMQNDYEKRTRENYQQARSQLNEFENFKVTTKRDWIVEKQEIDSLLGNILTKLKTYKLSPYVPPDGLKPQDIEASWENFLKEEVGRKQSLLAFVRESRDRLRRDFAEVANVLNLNFKQIAKSLASVDGDSDLEEQLRDIRGLLVSLEALSSHLKLAEARFADCAAANIVDNQYTLLTYEDLSFDYRLTSASLTKKIAFIENQIIARGVTNVTAAQLDEWTETFKHFDKDNKNALNKDQFRGALQALGDVSGDAEFERIFGAISSDDYVSFQPFMEHVKSTAEDRMTAADCEAAFKNLAVDKEYITEKDLIMGGVSPAVVDYFKRVLPKSGEGFNFKSFVKNVFIS